MAGDLLIDRTSRMILLVERVYDTVWPWGLPGGIIEADESPLGACRREIREELGIDPIIEHLATIDGVPPRHPKTAGNMYLFTGHLPAQARIRLDPAELSAWTWVTPSEIPHLFPRTPRAAPPPSASTPISAPPTFRTATTHARPPMTVQHERLHEVATSFQAITEVRAAGGYAPIYQQMAMDAGTDPDLLAIAAAVQLGQNPPSLLLGATQILARRPS